MKEILRSSSWGILLLSRAVVDERDLEINGCMH
jgi:hypothetical protein